MTCPCKFNKERLCSQAVEFDDFSKVDLVSSAVSERVSQKNWKPPEDIMICLVCRVDFLGTTINKKFQDRLFGSLKEELLPDLKDPKTYYFAQHVAGGTVVFKGGEELGISPDMDSAVDDLMEYKKTGVLPENWR